MNVLLAAGVAAGSAFLIERMGLPALVGQVVRRARGCRAILADPRASDLEKERAMRRESVRLFALFGRLAGGSLLAIGAPLALVGALDALGVASLAGVVGTLARPAFLAAAFGIGGLAYVLGARASR